MADDLPSPHHHYHHQVEHHQLTNTQRDRLINLNNRTAWFWVFSSCHLAFKSVDNRLKWLWISDLVAIKVEKNGGERINCDFVYSERSKLVAVLMHRPKAQRGSAHTRTHKRVAWFFFLGGGGGTEEDLWSNMSNGIYSREKKWRFKIWNWFWYCEALQGVFQIERFIGL